MVATAQSIGLTCGDSPTTYGEIKTWCDMSGIDLTLWEVETVRHISVTFIASQQDQSEEKAPRPYLTVEGANRQAIDESRILRAQLLSMARV